MDESDELDNALSQSGRSPSQSEKIIFFDRPLFYEPNLFLSQFLKSSFHLLVPRKERPGASLQENEPDLCQKFVVSLELKTGRLFKAYNQPSEFFRIYSQMPEQKRMFYEVVQEGKQKLKFDLDFSLKKLNLNFVRTDAERCLCVLVKHLLKFLQQHGVDTKIEQDIMVFSSHGEGKFSFHVVVDNYFMASAESCQFASNHIMNDTITEVSTIYKDVSPQTWESIFDNSINKRNQQFRMLGSHKYGTTRYKTLCQEWRYFDQKIVFSPNTHNDLRFDMPHLHEYLIFERSLISFACRELPIISYEIPQPVRPVRPVCDIGDINEQNLSAMIPKGWLLDSRMSNFPGYRLKKETTTECLICKRIHEHDNQYILIVGDDQKVYFKCHRNQQGQYFLGRLKPIADFVQENNTSQEQPQQQRHGYRLMEGERIINQEFVGDIEPSIHKILLIKSYLGTGKTASFINYVRKHNFLRVLILSPRRLYAVNITAEYNCTKPHLLPKKGEDFACYLSEDTDVNKSNRLVLQMESLHKLKVHEIPPFDVLILDEIEALLSQFSSSETMDRPIDCCQTFEHLIKNTPIVIGGDAFLGHKSIRTLQALGGNLDVIINEARPVTRKAYEVGSFDNLTYVLFQKLEEGKKIVFVCGSREKAIKIAERCEEKGIGYKLYTSKPDDPIKNLQDLANVNDAWSDPEVQLVLFTSTITCGVNFDTKGVFDVLFMYATSRGASCRDLFQGSLRVRHLNDNEMYYSLYKRPNGDVPTTREGVIHYFEVLKEEITKLNTTLIWKYAPEWLRKCLVEKKLEQNRSNKYISTEFEKFLHICNYEHLKLDLEINDDLVLPDHPEPLYQNIPDIQEDVFTELSEKKLHGMASAGELLMLVKHRFKGVIDSSASVQQMDEFFKERKKVYNIQAEKFPQIFDDRLRHANDKKYIEMVKADILKLEYVRMINEQLGICDSCQEFTLSPEVLDRIAPWFASIFPKIHEIFGITSEAQEMRSFMTNVIEKLYIGWRGGKIDTRRYRIQIDKKRMSLNVHTCLERCDLWNLVKCDKLLLGTKEVSTKEVSTTELRL